ncbi:MAG TPA: NAD(P)H-dependent oxidoreductase [Allosphingosinicella sp.]|jgi:chromate reductase
MPRKVAVIVGSLRKGSFSRATGRALAALAPASLELEIVEIGDLPFYDQDLDEGTPPAQWSRFRETIAGYDGVIFVTPEYNRSLPAVIKNAIDVGSRPYGAGVWNGKPAGVVSLSVGGTGGFGANHHLRQTLVFLNMPTLQQPEAYYGNAGTFFDEEGNLANEGTKKVMQGFIDAYAAWVETILG